MTHPTEIEEKIAEQVDFCHRGQHPMFAPSDGVCASCLRQIYAKLSMERAGSELITGCPHCSYSFVD